MINSTDRLRAERAALRTSFDANGRSAADTARMNEIDRILAQRRRRNAAARGRSEFMRDLGMSRNRNGSWE
jgi:hypothetical protein